jgi:hypothetical protein
MSDRTTPLTIMFYVAFALWFTATRYSSPGFYDWLLAPIVGDVLRLCTFALFFIVAILAVRRATRAASFPWLDGYIAGGAIVGFDLFWRFFLSPLARDAFKLASISLDIGTPLIAALGVGAMIAEVRRPAQGLTS